MVDRREQGPAGSHKAFAGTNAMTAVALGCAVLVAGCGPRPGATTPPGTGAAVTAEETLETLVAEHWERTMERAPVWATYLGDHRYDDRLFDNTDAAYALDEAYARTMIDRVEEVPADELEPRDRITRAVLLVELRNTIRDTVCRWRHWRVDPLNGPAVDLGLISTFHPTDTPERAAALIARYERIGGYLDTETANLRRGLAEGLVSARLPAERVIEQVDALLAKRPEETPFAVSADKFSGDRDALLEVVATGIFPALKRYRDFLETEVLPKARAEDAVGVSALPDGAACYSAAIRIHTGTDRTPEELHALGLKELERIHAEMNAIAAKLGGKGDFAAFAERATRERAFADRDAVFAAAEAAVAKAEARLPEAFGRLPATPVIVRRMEAFREKDAVAAFYYPPPSDGSRPGIYYVNTYKPETRLIINAEVLAFHEAVPGHHLQIALANERTDLPMFRRHGGLTAFVEGWALYSERLADEMGLYSDDYARFGMLGYEAWRAARLVVDTGLHHFGWTRAKAIDFMVGATALSRDEVANEVDRYIVWPGQALAYKSGQLAILELRERARAELGDRFDLRSFHDVLLSEGAVPMEVLGEMIDTWIATRK